jgi:hypothetical protein
LSRTEGRRKPQHCNHANLPVGVSNEFSSLGRGGHWTVSLQGKESVENR